MSDHTDILRRAQAHTDAATMLLKSAATTIQESRKGPETIGGFLRTINYWLCHQRDQVERLSEWIEDHVTGADLFCSHGQPPHIVNARLCQQCASAHRRKVIRKGEAVRREIQYSIIEEVRGVAARVRQRAGHLFRQRGGNLDGNPQSDADFLESVADMLQLEMHERERADEGQVTVAVEAPDGARRVAAERMRQIKVEGWDPDHDDEHDRDEMAWAAVCYAAPGPVLTSRGFDTAPGTRAGVGITFGDPWPWDRKWDKRSKTQPNRRERIRELEKAGALICAEIDRLLRAEKDDPTETEED